MRKRRKMTCEEFSARMAELVASGQDVFTHPHVKSCKIHRALLEHLEAIAHAAKQLFPDVDPSDRLWKRIEDEIAPMGGFVERVSDPFPGFRLVSRVRVKDKGDDPHDVPAVYEYDTGMGSVPMPGTRLRIGGHTPPPHPGEGRR